MKRACVIGNGYRIGCIVVLLCTIIGSVASAQSTGEVENSAASKKPLISLPKTFRDWWQTPTQQAEQAFEDGDTERLREVAPTPEWQAAAAYRDKDFETAKRLFSAPTESPGDSSKAMRQVYNSATTDVQLGDYASAIEQFDQILTTDPNHHDAARNRAIAQRLLELEQQPESQQSEDGEPGENSENSESEDDQSQDGEPQEESQQGQSQDQDGEPQNDAAESGEAGGDESGESAGAESEDASDADTGTPESREEEIEAAREALQQAGEGSEAPVGEQQGAPSDEPLSEEDQATEQWLRQIPDDPDDLLRRKLLQNHRSEYPDVQRNGSDY